MKIYLPLIFLLLFLPLFVFAADKIEINTASLQQLDEITGVGLTMAQRIIDARPFSSIDDLLKVRGIGEITLQKIKDQGLAYVNGQTQQPIVESESNPEPEPEITTKSETTPEPTKEIIKLTYQNGIVINEILPNPDGTDETNEWIELYNTNNFDVDISEWILEDTDGTKTTYTLPKDTKILSNSYLLLKRPDTKITLNNTTDGLNLMWPDKTVVDSVKYTNSPKNQSYNKTKSGWSWSSGLTPNQLNNIALAVVKNVKKALPNSKISGNNNIEEGVAAINQIPNQDIKTLNPWFLFFTVLSLTIISASLVLFIKLKLNKHVRT